MVKCSYCESDKHNISDCNIDNDLDKILYSAEEPDFNKMSIKILKKIAALTGLKTSYPKIQLVIMFKSTWRLKHSRREEELCALKRELVSLKVGVEITECPVCMETLGIVNCCTTKCGHKYCSDCFVKTVMKKNSCPMCRASIIDNDEYMASCRSNEISIIRHHRNGVVSEQSNVSSMSTVLNIIEDDTSDMIIDNIPDMTLDSEWILDEDLLNLETILSEFQPADVFNNDEELTFITRTTPQN